MSSPTIGFTNFPGSWNNVTSNQLVAIPADKSPVSVCKLVGMVGSSLPDLAADPDQVPEIEKLNGTGKIVTTMTGPVLLQHFPSGPITVKITETTFKIVDGVIKDNNDAIGVTVLAGDIGSSPQSIPYEITISVKDQNQKTVVFPAVRFNAIQGTVDYTMISPVPGDPANTVRGPAGRGVNDISLSSDGGSLIFGLSDASTDTVAIPGLAAVQGAAHSADVALGGAAAAVTASELARGYRDTAAGNSAAASDSATAAVTARTGSEAARDAAAASATAASGSATTAGTQASAAGTARTGAESARDAANGYAGAANTSAGAASTSATNAAGSATAADTARAAAVTAKTAAEAARDAAIAGNVADGAVSRTKLRTDDITNLVMGGSVENGLEATDWTVVSGAWAADTTQFWDGTKSLKFPGTVGELQGPGIPTSPGEVFVFSAMVYVPAVVTGAGGLRIQSYIGTTWSDITPIGTVFPDASSLAAATWTRCYTMVRAPAGTKRIRTRLAFSLSANPSGVFYDDIDFRRFPEMVVPDSVTSASIVDGSIQSGDLASGSVIAGKLSNGAVETTARLASGVQEELGILGQRWHDFLAFLTGMTATMETTTDSGANWTAATLNANPFMGKENQQLQFGSGAAGFGVRWTIVGAGTPISNVQAKAMRIGFPYTSAAQNRTILLESSPDGTTWTNRLNATNVTNNTNDWSPSITDWGTHTRIRITVISTVAAQLMLSHIKIYSQRIQGEGRGPETSLPFDWDFNQIVTFKGIKFPYSGFAQNKVAVSDASGNIYWDYVTAGKITDATITSAKFAPNILPCDFSVMVQSGTRATGLGDMPEGIRMAAAGSISAVVARIGTAGASGNTIGLQLFKNGAAVASAVATVTTTAAGAVASFAGMPVAFAAGDLISFNVTTAEATPGKRLYCDVVGTYTAGR